MSRRALNLAAVVVTLLITSSAWGAPPRNLYTWIEKPWAATSLLEGAVLAIGCAALARTRHRSWAALAIITCVGWGIVRVWLDPIFDPLIGVIIRRDHLDLGARLLYQAALFSLVIVPLTVTIAASARAAHFVKRPWRWFVAPGYLTIVAVLVIAPEFMTLTPF